MARYYFDLRNGQLTVDEEGLELRDLAAVQEEAALSLGNMARDAVRTSVGSVTDMAVEVRDDRGPVMLVKLTFQVFRKN